MSTRRSVIVSAIGLAIATPSRANGTSAGTDLIMAVLSRPKIKSLDENFQRGTDLRRVIGAQTPLVIEQNIASCSEGQLLHLFTSLTEDELQLWSVIYMGAVMNYGLRPNLLGMLAVRLPPMELGRVSRHFGFAPIYEAVVRYAPSKSNEFQRHSNPHYVAPGPWSPVPRSSVMRKVKFIDSEKYPKYSKLSPVYLEYTIYEIYLSFRTAPVGSLSVRAALYETAVFAGSRLATAFSAGYAVGTALSQLIQIYAPDLHDSIGHGIYNVVDWLGSAWSTGNVYSIAYSQQNSNVPFQIGSFNYHYPSYSDYNITSEWNFVHQGSGGGGGGCGAKPDGCPILE
jgi:hypothetical protein